MLRGAFRQAYLEAVYEWADPGGVAELLQINAAIIAGFMVPLRPEHQAFFREVATPLFKAQSFRHFSEQILQCAVLFLSKDASLARPLVESLLRFWPRTDSMKEQRFLNTLEEALPFLQPLLEEADPLIPRIFARVARCLESSQA